MALMEVEVSIDGGTPESRELYGRVQRAVGLTERLNRIPYDDRKAIRQAWIELTGTAVDERFHLIPPLYSDHGLNIRVGRNVFINQACVLNDIGGIEIGDDVMIGPRVSLLTAGHPLDPGRRRTQIVAAPIAIERNVWLGAGATVCRA
jgi:acetyltransferase-like isoleucine patch superfamily enzyme